MLSVIEVVAILLIAFVGMTKAPAPFSFNFKTSVEDIVLASILRALLISATYAYGNSRYYHR